MIRPVVITRYSLYKYGRKVDDFLTIGEAIASARYIANCSADPIMIYCEYSDGDSIYYTTVEKETR